MNFIRRLNRVFFFLATVLKLSVSRGGESWQQMQNFSTISKKLCQLGKKTQGHGACMTFDQECHVTCVASG